jgi:hypothetical protein
MHNKFPTNVAVNVADPEGDVTCVCKDGSGTYSISVQRPTRHMQRCISANFRFSSGWRGAAEARLRKRRERIHVSNSIRPWLRRAPRLLSAYLLLRNRGRAERWRQSAFILALLACWAAIVSFVLWAELGPAASTRLWMHRHALFLAGLSGFAMCAVVARRRALKRAEASRSWLAALPVRPSIARSEACAIEMLPALAALSVLSAAFLTVRVMVIALGKPMPLGSVWLPIYSGIIVGALVSYWVPAPRAIELPPGSRYVPKQAAAGARRPIPSLSALGKWPIRQMFARARPQAVARAVMPILLLVPLGSSADSAMVAVAIFAVSGAVVLLLLSTISVSREGCRWLLPLPLRSALLARALLIPSLAFIMLATSIDAWLLWVGGVHIARSVTIGAMILIVSSSVAVGGSFLSIYRVTVGNR